MFGSIQLMSINDACQCHCSHMQAVLCVDCLTWTQGAAEAITRGTLAHYSAQLTDELAQVGSAGEWEAVLPARAPLALSLRALAPSQPCVADVTDTKGPPVDAHPVKVVQLILNPVLTAMHTHPLFTRQRRLVPVTALANHWLTCSPCTLQVVDKVRGKLSSLERKTLSALVVIDVHARDVTEALAGARVASHADFEWTSQLR